MENNTKSSTAKPTLDRKAAGQINLNVIQRLDSSVEEVIATAGHVALYDFDVATSQWSRKDVEGSLFLVKRRTAPRFKFVILNKKGADNYWEDVGEGFNCEVQSPYILYRNSGGEVVGIWFYEAEDCTKFASIFQKIVATFAAPADQTIEVPGPRQATNSEKDGFWDTKAEVTEAKANPLAQVFAGMKVQTKEQEAPSVGTASTSSPPLSLLPLLTPQQLLLGSGTAAAPSGHLTAPSGQAQATSNQSNQGALLLESLNKSGNHSATPARAASTKENADKSHALAVSKVQTLLQSLSQNRAFCTILAEELGKIGFWPGDASPSG